mmetsp:Transcript_16679/g.37504  ORF Transcript_16679/g.37504 Transcript_16679/m.37504 type:complete len:218 (+) Transcript_16679:3355-4008(+)
MAVRSTVSHFILQRSHSTFSSPSMVSVLQNAARESWMSLQLRISQSMLMRSSSRLVLNPHFLQIFCLVCRNPKVWLKKSKCRGAHFFKTISNRSNSFMVYSLASFCCHTSNSKLRQLDVSTNPRGSKCRFCVPSSDTKVRCSSSSRRREVICSVVSSRACPAGPVPSMSMSSSAKMSKRPVSRPGRPSVRRKASSMSRSTGGRGGGRSPSILTGRGQ